MALLNSDVAGLSPSEKGALARKALFEYERSIEHPEDNNHKPWTDDELRVILSTAPTRENTLKLTRAFRRGYGSIEQTFRWAGQSDSHIASVRPDDAFA
ncbi:hypothetical protein [Truepera radiovictrix]|uniref:hypothetical protein n=1 Tax=Truepera radiovictrix TaxID=332249 RepID=UPI00160EDEE4|nr:hypothetical protein [Truepera radiovictrix]